MEARRLFDIVGLDEGTCGRRLRSSGSFRPWTTGQQQAVPYVYYISISLCDVQEWLLEAGPMVLLFQGGLRGRTSK